MDTCAIEGCIYPRRARTWCGKHYQRWKKYGDPTELTQERDPLRKDAWLRAAALTDSNECLDWPWSLNNSGYGIVRWNGSQRMLAVSHVVLLLSGRPRPPAPNDHALHSCDNRRCGNHLHLRWGSNAENAADTALRKRHPVRRGELHPRAKLSNAEATTIAVAYHATRHLPKYHPERITLMDLANYYGVTIGAIAKIVRGRRLS